MLMFTLCVGESEDIPNFFADNKQQDTETSCSDLTDDHVFLFTALIFSLP